MELFGTNDVVKFVRLWTS